ncbi:MAG TPA: pitrilysin family protein [Longimicrobiales bacterium]
MRGSAAFLSVPTFEHRLGNGLTVLIREDHSAPVVAIVTHVKAGYFNEPDRLVGISHVLEHMYFKGTEQRRAGDIARETKGAGGYLNAGTIYDHTSYYTVLPSSALELGLDVQSDALRNSQIDEEELRRELLVIIQEARRKLDDPGAVAVESLYELMFDVHRIRRWRIGTEEGLRRLTRADVWEYYRNLYRPSNIVLVVAGDVDPARTLELVERFYGDMPPGEPVQEPAPEEPERIGLRFREMEGDIIESRVAWGWRTPGPLAAETPALDLLAAVLGQGRASRLYQRVRERGLATSITASNYTPVDIGVFSVSAAVEPADVPQALAAIWGVVEGVRSAGIDEPELERAKSLLEARFLRRLETMEGQANVLAEWQALGDWRLAATYLDQLLAVTREDVQRVARDWLSLDRASVLVYRPATSPALGWSADGLPAVLGATDGGEPEGGAARADAGNMPAGPAIRQVRRPPRLEPDHVEDGVHFYHLANGARIAIKPRGSSPLVALGVFRRGGASHEPAERAGITAFMARTSIRGTARRSAARLAEETEALGGVIMPAVSADVLAWTLTIPAHHFARGLDLLLDAALHPVFPEEEVERERKVALADLEQVRDDMYRYPLRLFLEGAFEGHPYGFSLAATDAALRSVTAEELRAWHAREVLEGAPWVLAVGGVEPDEAAAAIAAELAGLPAVQPQGEPPQAAWPAGTRKREEARAKAQTALVLGFPGPDRADPARHAAEVLSNVLSGLGARFFEELRSRRSLAYTVAAYPITRPLAGAFVGYIATAPEREEEARQGLLEGFARLREEAVTAEELERAKRYTVGAWQIRSQTNAAQLGDLADALLLGRGLAELREFEAAIRAVTADAILDLARRYFDPERVVEGIVRGAAAAN